MKSYIGTKVVKAVAMNEDEYQSEKRVFEEARRVVGNYQNGECLFRSIDGAKPQGHSVSCKPKDGYKVMYEDGYISWSPKEVFERCYREITEKEKGLVIC